MGGRNTGIVAWDAGRMESGENGKDNKALKYN
jgi:hypothetical protein